MWSKWNFPAECYQQSRQDIFIYLILLTEDESTAKHIQPTFALLNIALCDPPTDGSDALRGCFLTMTLQQGGAPLLPRYSCGLSTPGSRGSASFASVLITVRHAHHAVSATQGQSSTDSAFLTKSQPAWCKFSRYTGSRGNECKLTEDLQWM